MIENQLEIRYQHIRYLHSKTSIAAVTVVQGELKETEEISQEQFALEKIMEYQAKRCRGRKKTCPVFVKLSGQSLKNEKVRNQILYTLNKSGIPGDLIGFEIDGSTYTDMIISLLLRFIWWMWDCFAD